MKIVQHQDLMYNKYNIEILEYNIDNLGLRRLLVTQTLTVDFCVKYLLNPEEHGMCVEDNYISKNDILFYQPHITKEQLDQEIIIYKNNIYN